MHRRVALLSVAALALAGALVPAQAQATGTADHRPVRWSGADSSSERRTVLQYWTTQRMMAAQPMDTMAAPRRATRSGGPTRGEPWAARGDAARTGQRATQRTPWRTQGSGNQARGAQTQQAVPNSPGLRWTDGGAVVRTSGRLFFTTAEGANASCSGTAVTSANESVVMTAGHCVKLNGAAHRNVAFVPSLRQRPPPLRHLGGDQAVHHAAVERPRGHQLRHRRRRGRAAAGTDADRRRGRAGGGVQPGAAAADVRVRLSGGGAVRRLDPDLLQRAGVQRPGRDQGPGVRCNMTGGSSGGGWFLGFNESTGLGMLNSVNSFTYDFAPGFMFGPFFGDEAMEVYQAAQNSGAL
ncbi:peptidase [Nonomuraea ferruginea]